MSSEFYLMYQFSYPIWGYLLLILTVGWLYFFIKFKKITMAVFAGLLLGAWGVVTYDYVEYKQMYDNGDMDIVVGQVEQFKPHSKVKRQYQEQFVIQSIRFSHSLTSKACLGANEANIKNGDYLRIYYVNKGGTRCILRIETKI
ncbi:MAG: hypothetical protein ACPGR2_04745 [Psychrobium sp.]